MAIGGGLFHISDYNLILNAVNLYLRLNYDWTHERRNVQNSDSLIFIGLDTGQANITLRLEPALEALFCGSA